MKKGMTMEQYMAELEEQKMRAEAFADVIKYLDREIAYKCDKIEVTPSRYEEYVDEETGETKKKYIWPTYELDENGDEKLVPPEEGSYNYPMYRMLMQIKDEILAII